MWLLRQRRRVPGFDSFKEGCEGRDCPGIERIANPRVGDFSDDEPGVLEDAQVLRCRRCREPDLFDEVAADAGRPPQQGLDDLDPRWMG